MPPGIQQLPREETSNLYQPRSNPSGADILREQEAAFARLTRELEAERQSVSQKVQQYKIGSETVSMNSISSTDDTFQWGGPQDDSLRYMGDESHGLMDSCLQELDNRANMNYGEDNMNYMPEESYNSGGGRGGYPGEYSSYNGGPYHDQYTGAPPHDAPSVHSSHVSLHSTGSNRNNPKQLKLSHSNLGSRTSLPHEQQSPSGDNYGQYPNHQRNYEDYGGGGSPMPSNGSPRGQGTPTRFTNHYDDYGDSYRRTSPLAYGPSSPGRYGSQEQGGPDRYGDQDSFENPMQHPHLDVPNHSEPFRAPPDDRFNQPEDSFYRQSPMLDNRYGNGPEPRYNGGQDTHDNYMDYPSDGYRGDERYNDDSFQGRPDNSMQRQPEYDGGQPPYMDRYGQPLNESYTGQPLNESYQDSLPHQSHPDNSYQGPGPRDNRYGDQPLDDSYRGPGDESFRDQPPQDDRFQNYADSYRGRDPNEGYDDQPTNQSFQHDPHDASYRDDGPVGYGDDGYRADPDRRHEGLPPVQDDPFADDPFRQKQRSLQHLREEENGYPRGPPSPGSGSDRMGPGSYSERPPQYDHMDRGQPPYEGERRQEAPQPYYDDDVVPGDARMLQNQPEDYPDDGRGTPSINDGTMRWRAPDLQEVIDYLSHPSEAIKANAAGYLTHLSYMDDGIKQKVRGLDGIPLLVDLLNSDYPEVHRNACGALKNLSYGKNNVENKRAVKNAGGIPALVRLLRKTQDFGVKDSVTGVLWNLSSADDLKAPIIDDGLAVLVNVIIIPLSGWDERGVPQTKFHDPWSTVFRNATGVLRNVSSDGPEARKKLRECQGLVDSLIFTLRNATEQNNLDNKPVENCVCTLRNLAFRIQEVEDPNFYRKRNATLQRQKKQEKEEKIGCLGRKKVTKKGVRGPDIDQMEQPRLPPTAKQFSALWGVDAMRFFLHLLSGSNPVTLEAACGAVQNLAACDWRPAVEIRALVRKEKGLPSLVDLLTYEVERVVGAAATALRNLAIDDKNKELVGKYAMKQLISSLPQDNRPKEQSDDTVCAVLACLNEVIPSNQDFARAFCNDHGLPRLMCIIRNQTRYSHRTVKATAAVLKTLWKFKVLHNEYQSQGYSEKDFHPQVHANSSQPGSNFSTPFNTLSRPGQGQGYDDTTLSSRAGNKHPNSHMGNNPRMVQGHSNPALDQQDRYVYGSKQGRLEEVPMSDIGPGYAPIDDQRQGRVKPPVGGVALFPNLPPGQLAQQQHQQQQHHPSQEPLYAKVNKKRQDEMGGNHSPTMMLGSPDGGDQGADSWV